MYLECMTTKNAYCAILLGAHSQHKALAVRRRGIGMRRLTAFTWGYWGWGSHTKEFVRMVDAIERDRGWQPPLFVDIRFSRSVRAVGFRQDLFERVTGQHRYKWM